MYCTQPSVLSYVTQVRHALQRQFRLYIPFLGIARPQPQFPHSCVCERFIYSQDRSTWFLQQNRQTHHGNICIIRSQTHECGNWDWGPDIPFLGIFVSNFRHFVFAVWPGTLVDPYLLSGLSSRGVSSGQEIHNLFFSCHSLSLNLEMDSVLVVHTTFRAWKRIRKNTILFYTAVIALASFLLGCICILWVQGFPWGPAERLLSPIWRGFRGCSRVRDGGSLQMKGLWKSNINVCFPFMYSQKWNCYFQNRIIMFCLPVPTLIYLWEIHIFPGSVCLFCCREICGPILGIYKSLTDTCMWELGLRPHNYQKMNTYMRFCVQCHRDGIAASGIWPWAKTTEKITWARRSRSAIKFAGFLRLKCPKMDRQP